MQSTFSPNQLTYKQHHCYRGRFQCVSGPSEISQI